MRARAWSGTPLPVAPIRLRNPKKFFFLVYLKAASRRAPRSRVSSIETALPPHIAAPLVSLSLSKSVPWRIRRRRVRQRVRGRVENGLEFRLALAQARPVVPFRNSQRNYRPVLNGILNGIIVSPHVSIQNGFRERPSLRPRPKKHHQKKNAGTVRQAVDERAHSRQERAVAGALEGVQRGELMNSVRVWRPTEERVSAVYSTFAQGNCLFL